MAIKLQSGQIPQNAGVYFFKNSRGKILYIGKAANLRARLRSRILPKETESISWEVLGSEVEALIREAELIKKYRPKYNVLMRDDKQYFYVGFTHSTSSGQAEKFPKIFVTHQRNREADYIGPFTEGGALRSVLKTLRHAFPYCTCKKPHKNLCLNTRIGRCLGHCCVAQKVPRENFAQRDGVSKAIRQQANMRVLEQDLSALGKYQKNIRAIKQILSGKNKSLVRRLKKEMHKLSDAKKYEEAGKARNQIYALEKIFAHRGVIKQDLPTESAKALRALESILKIGEIKRIEAYDVANIQGKFAYGSMAVFIDGKPTKENYRLFKIRSVRSSNDPAMLKEVIFRRLKHREWPYPQVIIVDGGKPQLSAAKAALNPSKSPLRKGRKLKIIALTKNKKHIGDHIFIEKQRNPIALERLPEPLKNLILHLDSEAHRFAISHYRKLHRKSLLT